MAGLMTSIGDYIGGQKGAEAAAEDRAHAIQLQQDALQRVLALHPELVQLQSAGQLNPKLVEAIAQKDTELGKVNVDQGDLDAQKAALGQLTQIGNSGGMRIQDQADLNKILSQTAQQNAGQQGAIKQNFAQRGMGGSGFELASELAAQQNAATNASNQGTQVAAQAQNRALQSLLGAGQLGGQMANEDYQRKAAAAKAQDIINQMNTQNQIGTQNYNVGASNAAQASNLAQAQRIKDQNMQAQNALYNQQMQQAMNAANVSQGVSQAYGNQANQKAEAAYNQYAGIGKAFDAPAAALAGNSAIYGGTGAKSSGAVQDNSSGGNTGDSSDPSGEQTDEEKKNNSGGGMSNMMAMFA